jgi:hypothetical protein
MCPELIADDYRSIPIKFTCDGENINPLLKILGVPPEAKELVLIMDDPDAPVGTFNHWLMWHISPDTKEIGENSVPKGVRQGTNDFGQQIYGGPCPPDGTHRYFFRLYALDQKLHLEAGAKRNELDKAMEGKILEEAEVMGVYTRV